MEIKDIYEVLDEEIKRSYKSRSKFSTTLGLQRSVLQSFMNKLKDGTGIKLRSLKRLCDGLGYEIVVRKKEERNTAK